MNKTTHHFESLFEASVVVERLTKLKERAAKHGWDVTLEWELVPASDEAYELELTYGGSFSFAGGWRLVAIADASLTLGEEPLVYKFAEVSVGEIDLTRCDHCERKIARRKVLILESESGEIIHVGGSCAVDFFGHDPLWATWIAEAVTEPTGGFAPSTIDLKSLVRCALEAYRLGYRRTSETFSNKELVLALVSGRFWKEEKYAGLVEALKTAPPIVATPEEIIEWAATAEGDFGANLAKLVSSETVSLKAAGLIAYAPAGFDKWRERVARLAAEREAKPSAPVPIGRTIIEGTVGYVKSVINDYGETWKFRVVSDEGWAVWGTRPRSIESAVAGDRVRFTATIEPSEDSDFGFFKRPAKAEILEVATAA